MADVVGKIKDIESLRAVLRSYKQDPENIPFSEWKSIVSDFCGLVDKDLVPFEPNLAAFCHYLVSRHSDEVEDICVECELTDDCNYKEEKKTTSFNSFNLGMLYGIALARILYTEETGDDQS